MNLTKISNSYELVKILYKNDDGQPFEMTPGQVKLFDCIWKRKDPRNHVMTYTQYGKSDVVAMAVLTRGSTFAEKWPVVAPTGRKARIIMGFVIKHIFENPYTRGKFRIGKDESEERIKRERSKQRITFKVGENQIGEIFILSGDARRIGDDAGDSLIGFGAPNLIEDESSLIPNTIHAKAMRMLGGHKDNFLVKIGNPFKRNHFLKSYQSDRYKKIEVDYKQGIKEGRVPAEFIEEMREEAFFGVLYECKFPDIGEIDEGGWTALLSDTEVKKAMERKVEPAGKKKLGNDVARGGNYNVWVVRQGQHAYIKEKNRDPDLMSQVGKTRGIMERESIEPAEAFIDDVGVGGGVVDRLKEQDLEVNPVKVGERAQNSGKFVNVKAEAYWEVRKWVKAGGALEKSEDWYQLCDIKYKEDSSSKLKIMGKEEMRKQGIDSPDVAEALMLTFAKKETAVLSEIHII